MNSWDDVNANILPCSKESHGRPTQLSLMSVRHITTALIVLALFGVPLGLILIIATKPFYPLALCGATVVGLLMALWADRKHGPRKRK